MLTHCVDEQRSMQPQTPAARRVAAARAHLLRCASSAMEGIAFVGTPRIWPPWRTQRGPRDFRLGPLEPNPRPAHKEATVSFSRCSCLWILSSLRA